MGYYTTTIQKGSQGDEVKKWQNFLNTQGYNLSVDGIFGSATDEATRAFQNAKGIGDDGIVGKYTWGAAGFKDYNALITPVSAPTIEPAPTQPTLTYTPYGDTTEGGAKKTAADTALEYLNKYGSHTWANDETYNEWLQKKLNREDFSYDLNSDALYQQYADQYRNMGKLAMEDAIGQASAMTGGYGNSYAASVGNQAYQAYLGKLNEIVPELYQLALNKYTMEGDKIDSNLAALGEDYNRSLNDWQTGYGLLMDKYNIANSDYYNSASLYGTEQDAINTLAQQNYQNAFAAWEADNTNAWNQAKWEEDARQWEYENYGGSGSYGGSGGTGGSGSSGGSGGSGSGSGGGTTTTEKKGWKDFDQGTLEANQAEAGGSYYTTARGDIDDMIKSGASYDEMMSYAQEMVGNSLISKSEYQTLVQYIRNNKTDSNKSTSYKDSIKNTKSWSVVDKGGSNLFGVDENAKVKAPDGKTWRLDDLKEALIKEGMSEKEAKNAVKKLQQDLGISSNWFFGL